jgi:hypothetical protein
MIPNINKFEEFEARHRKIDADNHTITLLVNAQNEKFTKLWNGFIALKYVDPNQTEEVHPIEQVKFVAQLEIAIKEMDRILFIIYEEKDRSFIESCERQIIEIYKLVAKRWSTIIQLQKLRKEEMFAIREKQNNLTPKLAHIEKRKATDNSETEAIFKEIEKLIDEEELILLKSENYCRELNHLLIVRDRLFNTSSDLFVE